MFRKDLSFSVYFVRIYIIKLSTILTFRARHVQIFVMWYIQWHLENLSILTILYLSKSINYYCSKCNIRAYTYYMLYYHVKNDYFGIPQSAQIPPMFQIWQKHIKNALRCKKWLCWHPATKETQILPMLQIWQKHITNPLPYKKWLFGHPTIS